MNTDQILGATIMVVSILVILVYGYLVFMYPLIVLQITVFLVVAVLLGILAWIGYTLLTTPAPKPIEETPESNTQNEQTEQK
ncbi:MAG: transcriptional regulator [Nitrososphaeria archaeon]|jgi:predicted DNA-binding transcriptional regulator